MKIKINIRKLYVQYRQHCLAVSVFLLAVVSMTYAQQQLLTGYTLMRWQRHIAQPAVNIRHSQIQRDTEGIVSEQLHGAADDSSFPEFGNAIHPVTRIPNWGAMRTPEQWNRIYSQLERRDFVRVPRYDIAVLTTPLVDLVSPIRDEQKITTKLYYSTRHFGVYDIDAPEYSGLHPGMDLKLAKGTPVGALGGGQVHAIERDANMGLYVILEHRIPGAGIFFSIYGHLDTTIVYKGQAVRPGDPIGTVGMSGSTSSPHLHLQVDRDRGLRPHVRFWPETVSDFENKDSLTVHPINFIANH